MQGFPQALAVVHDIVHLELLDLAQRLDDHRMVEFVAEAPQRYDGVRHRRINGADPSAAFDMLQRPVRRLPDRPLPQPPYRHPVVQPEQRVQRDEQIVPREPRTILLQRRHLVVADPFTRLREEFLDPLLVRYAADRPVFEHDQ